MRLWTIHTPEAWAELNAKGFLRCDSARVFDESFRPAYEWMTKQMTQRIGSPPTNEVNPIWAWYQWRTQHRPKPDLRAGGYLDKGKRGIRIEFNVDERRALLSDFDLWHYVLNYWYLPVSEKDGEAFDGRLAAQGLSYHKTKPLPTNFHDVIEQSWNRIFDLDFAAEDISSPREQKSIQACLWEVRLPDVTGVVEFMAR
jgi:hypothetical protein